MANSNNELLNFICSSCILNQLTAFPRGLMINDEVSQVTSTQNYFSFQDDGMDEIKKFPRPENFSS